MNLSMEQRGEIHGQLEVVLLNSQDKFGDVDNLIGEIHDLRCGPHQVFRQTTVDREPDRGHRGALRVVAADGPEERLYRLPDEETDRSPERLDVARRLAAKLDAGLASFSEPRNDARSLSDEEAEGLRALGYLEAEPQ